MNITTKQWAIDTVAERWARQYTPTRILAFGENSDDIYRRLKALPSTATSDDVVRIIGNDSWITLRCDECGRSVDAYVTLGEEQNYESATARICKDCIRKALALFVVEARTDDRP